MGLQPLDDVLPLPNRVALSIVAGIWGWAAIVWIENIIHVDIKQLLKYSDQLHPEQRLLDHRPILRFAVYQTIGLLASTCIFWLAKASSSGHSDFAAWVSVMVLVLGFFYNGKLCLNGRKRFLELFNLTKFGYVDLTNRFPCILFADALTSYGRVVGDAAVMTGMAIAGHSLSNGARRDVLNVYLAFAISCWPNTVRMRQCTIDYFATGAQVHLANFLKYSSGILVSVTWFAYKSGAAVESPERLLSTDTLWTCWVFSAVINSSYTFFWDVKFDWNLQLFDLPLLNKVSALRPVMYFPSRTYYYAVVCIDFCLRFIWVLRLLPQYDLDSEWAQFALGSVEIFRRWIWAIFRIEAEWAKTLDQHRLPTIQMQDWDIET